MHAKIVLRQITSPTMDFVGLAHASSYDLDPRADCQAITLGPSELKADPMPARDPVVSKNHGATVQILYHHVHVSIIKKIAYCQAAGHASFHDRRAGLIAGVAEFSAAQVHVNKLRLAKAARVRKPVSLRICVSRRHD